MFASTQLSDVSFSGWHALKECLKKVDLKKPGLINATNNRHRVSTDYAALHLSESERSVFYKHMGHSESMNEDVYQTPQGITHITTVGKRLMEIQIGKLLHTLIPSEKKFPQQEIFTGEIFVEIISQFLAQSAKLKSAKYVKTAHLRN